MWNRKHKNIDCLENIVSLCPTCHRAIHHGEFDVKLAILKHLYDIRIDKLKDAGIDHLKVVYSKEEPRKHENSEGRKPVPASNAFVPAAAGLIIAGEVVKDIIKE